MFRRTRHCSGKGWRKPGRRRGFVLAALRRMMVGLMAFAAGLILVSSIAGNIHAQPAPNVRMADDRCVILVSLDGFAHFYVDDPLTHMPTLRRMIREGAVAE